MGCDCGKPKCDGECGISPAVLQITNPPECVLFHKVVITSAMGNEVTVPPSTGLYKNTLLYYEATGNAYFYSSDGIPTLITYTDYLRLSSKPSINGVTLAGNKTLGDLGVQAIMSGATAGRPTDTAQVGQMFFDTTLEKPIWYKGAGSWVDATGTTV